MVEKCTFCVQRVDRGEMPACVETCPSKARVFGDITDPDGKLQQLLATREYRLKKPETGNGPKTGAGAILRPSCFFWAPFWRPSA